jgi:hypothetical protein
VYRISRRFGGANAITRLGSFPAASNLLPVTFAWAPAAAVFLRFFVVTFLQPFNSTNSSPPFPLKNYPKFLSFTNNKLLLISVAAV